MTATVYFVRHGQTYHNLEERICGQIEAKLTPEGYKQAATTAQKLAECGVHFDAILCSPLQRAQETAAPIAQATQTPIYYDAGLMELNFGIYENVLLADLFKIEYNPPLIEDGFTIRNGRELRELYRRQEPEYDNIRHPQGESKAEARKRFLNTIADFLDNHPEIKNLCVVAHGAVIRIAMAYILKSTTVKNISNAEVKLVHYSETLGFFAK